MFFYVHILCVKNEKSQILYNDIASSWMSWNITILQRIGKWEEHLYNLDVKIPLVLIV